MVMDLPLELLEEIINEASRTSDVSTISSIALTSHAFRILANKRRFQSLVLCEYKGHNMEHTAKRIKTLADLIVNGHSTKTMLGVCEFVTSFSLQMIGYYDEVTPVIEDGCLARIFDNLFRSTNLRTLSAHRAFSLSIYEYRWARTDAEYFDDNEHFPRYNKLSWNSMGETLFTVLRDLIQLSQLNRLILQKMVHVPRNLLQGSNVKHFHLSKTKLSDNMLSYNGETSTSTLVSILLESLNIDSLVSDNDIGAIVYPYTNITDASDYLYPCLVHFTIYVPYVDMLVVMNKILGRSLALRCLVVELCFIFEKLSRSYSNQKYAIKYTNLVHLESISLKIKNVKPSNLASILSKHGVPSSLMRISITVSNWTFKLERETIIQDLSSININSLDRHLTHPAFDGVMSIDIISELACGISDYDEYINMEDTVHYCHYIRTQVPLLVEKKPGLEVSVTYK